MKLDKLLNWKKILIREWYLPQFNKAEKMVVHYRNVVAYGDNIGIENNPALNLIGYR